MATQKSRKPLTFAAIGVANTALDFGLLLILKTLGLPAVAANTVSTTVAFVFSFIMNRRYTFKPSGQNIKRELAMFIGVTLFGLWVLQNIVITLVTPFIKGLGFDENSALVLSKLLATVVSLVWNYIMYDKVVFKNKPTTD